MTGGLKDTVTNLIKKFDELYREIVTTSANFNHLQNSTKDSLTEFKRLLERAEDKIDRIERERIKNEAEILSKINGLEARLDALSEKALHASAKEAAYEIMNEVLRNKDIPLYQEETKKELSEGRKKSKKGKKKT